MLLLLLLFLLLLLLLSLLFLLVTLALALVLAPTLILTLTLALTLTLTLAFWLKLFEHVCRRPLVFAEAGMTLTNYVSVEAAAVRRSNAFGARMSMVLRESPDVLRGVHAASLLRRFGTTSREGPYLDPATATDRYALSFAVSRLRTFLSHSWSANHHIKAAIC